MSHIFELDSNHLTYSIQHHGLYHMGLVKALQNIFLCTIQLTLNFLFLDVVLGKIVAGPFIKTYCFMNTQHTLRPLRMASI